MCSFFRAELIATLFCVVIPFRETIKTIAFRSYFMLTGSYCWNIS